MADEGESHTNGTTPVTSTTTAVNYNSWDSEIQSAVTALPPDTEFSRAQSFVRTFPDCLTQFRTFVERPEYAASLPLPLATWQRHPTYLLRYLIAEWIDESTGVTRNDLNEIMDASGKRVHASQAWRNGAGENWKEWGFEGMDDFYSNYKNTESEVTACQQWFFQSFFGQDKMNRPVHFELLPNSYHSELINTVIQRRVINNEYTLRVRIPSLNLEGGPHHDPVLGCTWVLDARQLSILSSASLYKTMNAMMGYMKTYSAAHYPEQGYRAKVVNLGGVLMTLYNMTMKLLPSATRSTTSCYAGNDVLGEKVGWENVPKMFHKPPAAKDLLPEERNRLDRLPWEPFA